MKRTRLQQVWGDFVEEMKYRSQEFQDHWFGRDATKVDRRGSSIYIIGPDPYVELQKQVMRIGATILCGSALFMGGIYYLDKHLNHPSQQNLFFKDKDGKIGVIKNGEQLREQKILPSNAEGSYWLDLNTNQLTAMSPSAAAEFLNSVQKSKPENLLPEEIVDKAVNQLIAQGPRERMDQITLQKLDENGSPVQLVLQAPEGTIHINDKGTTEINGSPVQTSGMELLIFRKVLAPENETGLFVEQGGTLRQLSGMENLPTNLYNTCLDIRNGTNPENLKTAVEKEISGIVGGKSFKLPNPYDPKNPDAPVVGPERTI